MHIHLFLLRQSALDSSTHRGPHIPKTLPNTTHDINGSGIHLSTPRYINALIKWPHTSLIHFWLCFYPSQCHSICFMRRPVGRQGVGQGGLWQRVRGAQTAKRITIIKMPKLRNSSPKFCVSSLRPPPSPLSVYHPLVTDMPACSLHRQKRA